MTTVAHTNPGHPVFFVAASQTEVKRIGKSRKFYLHLWNRSV